MSFMSFLVATSSTLSVIILYYVVPRLLSCSYSTATDSISLNTSLPTSSTG